MKVRKCWAQFPGAKVDIFRCLILPGNQLNMKKFRILKKGTWLTFFPDVYLLERSTARIKAAEVDTVVNCSKTIQIIQAIK